MKKKQALLEIIKQKQVVRPVELQQVLNISTVAIHKKLKQLLEQGLIVKRGKPPLVFYQYVEQAMPQNMVWPDQLTDEVKQFLEDRYTYITPTGQILKGVAGFDVWLKNTKQLKYAETLAQEFKKVREVADAFYLKNPVCIDATEKINNTFEKLYLDKLFYQDFYSLPKFGKTKLGALVLYAKQAQNRNIIHDIANECGNLINQLAKKYNVAAVAWAPHSIPRKIPFLNELKKILSLHLPEIILIKAYSGEIPVAQKSLSKLEERIENARESIFIKKASHEFSKVLVIDDAVGSGATLNEIAHKLKSQCGVKSVYGFAIVGSYKGFEVIKEI